MRMVTKHVVPVEEQATWLDAAEVALRALGAQKGFEGGEIGAAVDQPDLLLITTRWASVGDYRRALSSFDVKLNAMPLLYGAENEPSGFEVLRELDSAGELTQHTPVIAADAHSIGIREAAGPDVPTRES